MTDADPGPQNLAELAKLPLTPGIVYRGVPDDAEILVGTTITSRLTTASSDPRVASDNFAYKRIFAIVARKARDLTESSAHPAEGERVLLPGTVLVPVGQILVDGMGATAQILEEVDPGGARTAGNSALPETVDDLIDKVVRTVIRARRAEPVELTSPGKYAGAIG